MRAFNYSEIKNQKQDSDVLGLIAAIYKKAGKQEMYLKQRPKELEKLFTPLAPYETPETLDRICDEYNRVIGNMEVEQNFTTCIRNYYNDKFYLCFLQIPKLHYPLFQKKQKLQPKQR